MASNTQVANSSKHEPVGARIQKIINSTSDQKAKHALLHQLPDEPEGSWTQILEQIEETNNVTVAHRDDTSFLLSALLQNPHGGVCQKA